MLMWCQSKLSTQVHCVSAIGKYVLKLEVKRMQGSVEQTTKKRGLSTSLSCTQARAALQLRQPSKPSV